VKLSVMVVTVAALGGCARGSMLEQDQADAATASPDGKPAGDDAAVNPMPDAPTGGGGTSSLLLTEVVLAPSTGEFIEIANPSNTAVDLSTYYLSDNGNYFRLPAGLTTIDSTDFLAKFPAGASIAAHGVITVALDTTGNYMATYGIAPTYSLASLTMTNVVSSGVPSLTNAGEVVVLFRWDGQSDLVKDVDLMLAGAPTVANSIVDKSTIAIDGPDAGTAVTAYAADARTLPMQGSTPPSGKSTKRLVTEVGHETQSGGGNGITGDDETSEDTAATWDSTGFGNPTPGVVPAALQ
jgi:hypothetical protein